jgi:hypothetical protein
MKPVSDSRITKISKKCGDRDRMEWYHLFRNTLKQNTFNSAAASGLANLKILCV